jgi:hypothetical protein
MCSAGRCQTHEAQKVRSNQFGPLKTFDRSSPDGFAGAIAFDLYAHDAVGRRHSCGRQIGGCPRRSAYELLLADGPPFVSSALKAQLP